MFLRQREKIQEVLLGLTDKEGIPAWVGNPAVLGKPAILVNPRILWEPRPRGDGLWSARIFATRASRLQNQTIQFASAWLVASGSSSGMKWPEGMT